MIRRISSEEGRERGSVPLTNCDDDAALRSATNTAWLMSSLSAQLCDSGIVAGGGGRVCGADTDTSLSVPSLLP